MREPARRVEDVAGGEDAFVMGDGVVVHGNGGVGRDGPVIVKEWDRECAREAGGDAIGEAEGWWMGLARGVSIWGFGRDEGRGYLLQRRRLGMGVWKGCPGMVGSEGLGWLRQVLDVDVGGLLG